MLCRRGGVTGLVGWAVTLAMTVVLSANCFAAAGQTPEERLCCASMHHDCGATAIERGCCSGEVENLTGLTPGALQTVDGPPANVLIALLETREPALLGQGVIVGSPTSQVKPPGSPPYLRTSALRI